MVGSFQSFRISFQFQLMEPNYLIRPQTDTAPLASYSVYLLVHKWYFIVIIHKVNQNAGSKLFHLLVIQLVDEMFRNLSTCYNSQQNNNVNFQTTAVVRFLFFKLWQNYLHLFTTGVYCHLKNLCTSKFRIK